MGILNPLREQGLKLLADGKIVPDVARELGVSRSTVQGWRDHLRIHGQQPTAPVAKEAVQEMRQAAQRSQVRVQAAYQPPPEHSPEARWKAAELDNAECIKRAMLMAEFSVDLPAEPCAITFVSDQHISIGNSVDLHRMREDAELIASVNGCYAILGGDATDNHIKHRAAVLAARSQPSDQYDLFEYYLSIFAHRILVGIAGNHDLWTNQFAGVDVLGMLHEKHRVCYAPDEAILKIMVGKQPYKVGMRHQFNRNSQLNQTHAPKTWMREQQDVDIGCIGHHHIGSIEPVYLHGLEKWACRPGSYQITSAYARQFGYGSTRPTCPTFILSPSERSIVGFHNLRPAITYLKAVRG